MVESHLKKDENDIEVEEFDSAKEFIDFLRPSNEKWKGPVNSWIFRGQRESCWGLTPKLFRPRISEEWIGFSYSLTMSYPDFISNELKLLQSFAKDADSVGLKVPGDCYEFRILENPGLEMWPREEYMEVLAIAQHHGIPTRLLDFTSHGLIAAFFAAWFCLEEQKGNDDGTLAVWAFNLHKYHENFSLKGGNRNLQHVTLPTYDNNFMNVQKGLFLFDKIPHRHWGIAKNRDIKITDLNVILRSDIKAKENNLLNEKFDPILFKYTIKKALARDLIGILSVEGIHIASIMPTYENVVEKMKFDKNNCSYRTSKKGW